MDLMLLPDVVLVEIFSYLTFDEVAKFRMVSRIWNDKCKNALNRGFFAVERYHSQCFKKCKALLPRRESERRNHVMARHCDILTAIETRLSMLSMTYSKFIDAGLCCFIPGKVTDEIFRVLHSIKNMKIPQKTPREHSNVHEVLQELRDISSMAMEHFDEHIVPRLRVVIARKLASSGIPSSGLVHLDMVNPANAASSSPNFLAPYTTRAGVQITLHRFRIELARRARAARQSKKTVTDMRILFNTFIQKVNVENRQLTRQISLQEAKIKSQDTQLAEMKHQLGEWDHKFADLAAKLSRVVPETVQNETTTANRTIKGAKADVSAKPVIAEVRTSGSSKEQSDIVEETSQRGTKRTRAAKKPSEAAIEPKKSRRK